MAQKTVYKPVRLPKYSEKGLREPRARQRNAEISYRSEYDDLQADQRVVYENRIVKPKESNKESVSSEANKISRLVNWKLEYYFDELKRELCFNVNGRYRTTARLQKYDLMYKVMEATKEDKNGTNTKPKRGKTRRNENNKQKATCADKQKRTGYQETTKSSDKGSKNGGASKENTTNRNSEKCYIKPNLVPRARSLTLPAEAKRITSYANDIWDCEKVKKLSSMHNHQRDVSYSGDGTDTPKVLTYSRHPAAVLHAEYYAQYYAENGLHSGNPKNNARLLKLRKRINETDSKVSSSKCSEKSSTQSEERAGGQGPKKVKQKQGTSKQHIDRTKTAQTHKTKRSNEMTNAQSSEEDQSQTSSRGLKKM